VPDRIKIPALVLTLLLSAVAPRSFAQPSPTVTKGALEHLTTLHIPRLSREPKLEDFANMEPSPAVAGTMLKIDQL
jgi:hypothetical protein